MKYIVTNRGILTQEQIENTSPLMKLEIVGQFDTWTEAQQVRDAMIVTREQPRTPEQEQDKWFAINGNIPINLANAVRRQAEYERNNSVDDDETGQYYH